MSLELSMDDPMKNYAKSIRSLQKIIKKHPYTSSLKFLSLEFYLLAACGQLYVQIPSMYTSLQMTIKLYEGLL
jgi:hypothetical protein